MSRREGSCVAVHSARRARRQRGAFCTLGMYAIAALFLRGAFGQNTFAEAMRLPMPGQQQQRPSQPGGAASGSPRASSDVSRTGGAGTARQQTAGSSTGASADASTSIERQDFGVQPTAELHAGEMHGPTPNAIPGGQVITTTGLVDLLRGGQVPVLVLDVLGGPEIIQGAVYAVPAAQSGSYDDPVQQQFAQFLQQATAGNRQYPIVLYCLSTHCWMSYNAALRAIKLGYTNVLWYRGGIESWKSAGLPTQPGQR